MKIETILVVLLVGLSAGLEVGIDLDTVLTRVEPEFVSVCIDAAILGKNPKWQTFDFNDPRVHTLMKGLAPAYLRFGGTSADHNVFSNLPLNIFHNSGVERTENTYTTTDIDNMVTLVRRVGFKILLDFNNQLRQGIQFDPTNAAQLLAYIKKKNYQDVFNFELGNEPDLYVREEKKDVLILDGTRIGKDFKILHNVLKEMNFDNVTFVGADMANYVSTEDKKMFSDFVNEAGHLLSAITIHHYYFSGKTAQLADFTDVYHFDKYDARMDIVLDLIKKSKNPHLNLWLGESADAYAGGAPGLSGTYLTGFTWLDKLGVSARKGMGAIMRQTFYGGRYSLTEENVTPLTPLPDYWLNLLHKQLVGREVLDVDTGSTADGQEVRVYAHCTRPSSNYQKGSVTMFGLNLKESEDETVTFPAPLSGQNVDVYLLTPVGAEGLTSKQVALNGKTLDLVDDHTLPDLTPVQQSASGGVKIPARTFGFFVFPDANANACK